jgi:hypothetical protein
MTSGMCDKYTSREWLSLPSGRLRVKLEMDVVTLMEIAMLF